MHVEEQSSTAVLIPAAAALNLIDGKVVQWFSN
jgi:hypothetical protein